MFIVFMKQFKKPQSTEGLTRTFRPETFRKLIKAAIQNHVGGASLYVGGKYSHEQISKIQEHLDASNSLCSPRLCACESLPALLVCESANSL